MREWGDWREDRDRKGEVREGREACSPLRLLFYSVAKKEREAMTVLFNAVKPDDTQVSVFLGDLWFICLLK